ncbi:alpha/beta hydrolase fold domain-containing protein [Streptomyces sp. NPDC006879]|uniref:alpha/beta hydrolase fold domain-containing protein n=1 Tax=Streptomyces sp. NPDC006879 TaxID=3364767 RepID=UPI0036AA4484
MRATTATGEDGDRGTATPPPAAPAGTRRSRLLSAALLASGRRRRYGSAARVHEHIGRNVRRPSAHWPPRGLGRVAEVSRSFVGAWPVYDVAPRHREAAVRVLYLHGGTFIDEIGRSHWSLVRQLVTEAGAHCVVPAYTLAPRGTAERNVPAAADLLSGLITNGGTGGTVLLGTGAGGGLALAAAQRLRDRSGLLPSRIVLVSPWLDLSASHPGQEAVEPLDPVLGLPGLREAGRLYAGTKEATHPMVSPLYGKLSGLAPLSVFTGTRDVLHTDALELRERLRAAGADPDYHLAPGQSHGYPLLPVPEGRAARARIVDLTRAVAECGP